MKGETNTLIFLMDIDGHEGLTDKFTTQYRTYAFQDLINDSYLDRNRIAIASTGFDYDRSIELYKQATLDRKYNWVKVKKTDEFSVLEKKLLDVGFSLTPKKTNIIYGGTNTSGCVLHSSNFSMNKFCMQGYYCNLYLPLCDDAHIPGINSIDRNQKAFSEVYTFLKTRNLIERVDITTRFGDLTLPKSNKRFDYVST